MCDKLNVRPLTDKRAVKVLKQRDREIKEGKRKVISDAEFLSKYRYLLDK